MASHLSKWVKHARFVLLPLWLLCSFGVHADAIVDPAPILSLDPGSSTGWWCDVGTCLFNQSDASGSYVSITPVFVPVLNGYAGRIRRDTAGHGTSSGIQLRKGHYTLTFKSKGYIWIRVSLFDNVGGQIWNSSYVATSQNTNYDATTYATHSVDFDAPGGTAACGDGTLVCGPVDVVVQTLGGTSNYLSEIKVSSLVITPSTNFTFVNTNKGEDDGFQSGLPVTYGKVTNGIPADNWALVGSPMLNGSTDGTPTTTDTGRAYLTIAGAVNTGINRTDLSLKMGQSYLLTATGDNVTVGVFDSTGTTQYATLDVKKADNNPQNLSYQGKVFTVPADAFNYQLKIVTTNASVTSCVTGVTGVASVGCIKGITLKPVIDVDGGVNNISIPSPITLPANGEYVISIKVPSGAGSGTLNVDAGAGTFANNLSYTSISTAAGWHHYYYKSSSTGGSFTLTASVSITGLRIERGPSHFYQAPNNLRGVGYYGSSNQYPDVPLGTDTDSIAAMSGNLVRTSSADLPTLVTNVKMLCDRGIRSVINGAAAISSSDWGDSNNLIRLVNAWTNVATTLKNNNLIIDPLNPNSRDCVLGYDLMNEPFAILNSGEVAPAWPFWAQATINAIRTIDSQSWIVFESSAGQNGLGYMQPLADAKVIYSEHIYTNGYSIQAGANPWVSPAVSYPSGVITKPNIENSLHKSDLFEAKYQVPFFIGEFGAYKWAGNADQWMKDVIGLMEQRHWTWTAEGWREAQVWDMERNELYWGLNIYDNPPTMDPASQRMPAGWISPRLCAAAAGMSNNTSFPFTLPTNPVPAVWSPYPNFQPAHETDCDGDGVPDLSDNCPLVYNPKELIDGTFKQRDTDGDRIGDACDTDADGDGMSDAWEIQYSQYGLDPHYPSDANGNTDGDSLTNLQEYLKGTNPGSADTDGDGILDGVDNCPLLPNSNQLDTDGDGIGDACDADDDNDGITDVDELDSLIGSATITNPLIADMDGDGIVDGADNCPLVSNPKELIDGILKQRDTDNDGIGDVCDVDADNDGLTNAQEQTYGTLTLNHFDPPQAFGNDAFLSGTDWLDYNIFNSVPLAKVWSAADGSWVASGTLTSSSVVDVVMADGGSFCDLDAAGVSCFAGQYSSSMAVTKGVKLSMGHGATGNSDHACVLTALHTATCAYLVASPGNNTADVIPYPYYYAIDIAAGPLFTCEVYVAYGAAPNLITCWSADPAHQEYLGAIPRTPMLATDTKALSIAVGDNHLCAITQPTGGGSSSVQCWGDNTFGQTTVPATVTAPLSISAGRFHTCVVNGTYTNNGTSVICWGAGTTARGSQTSDDVGQSIVPALVNPVAVRAGGHRTCAVQAKSGTNGNVESDMVCWPVALGSTVVFGANPGPVTYSPSGTFNVSATTPTAPLPITYSSTTTGVCTVNSSSGVVTIVTAGTCTIAANASANTYFSAAQALQSITINPDTDGDGLADGVDNCPTISNANQLNTDGDSQGDACDTDDDNDGVLDVNDAYPLISLGGRTDTDGDGRPDSCDATCQATGMVADTDDDNDSIVDTSDNCPLISNTNQLNTDGDSQGDACDTDDDNDGILDVTDNCQLVANPLQINDDQATEGATPIGNACDGDVAGPASGAGSKVVNVLDLQELINNTSLVNGKSRHGAFIMLNGVVVPVINPRSEVSQTKFNAWTKIPAGSYTPPN